MKYPDDLRYNKEHLWVKVDGDTALIGITDYAQEQLGEILFVEMPDEDDELEINEEFGVVESSKKASTLLSPINGEVLEINEELEDEPELVNEEPYNAWIVKVKIENQDELNSLMDAAEYEAGLE